MINHFRTLLMNVDGSTQPGNYIAEEIIDPGYSAVVLPQALRTIRTALFGSNPDRHMLNYRCRQLLALIHASPLQQYVTAVDRRITYGFDNKAIATQWGIDTAIALGTEPPTFYGTLEAPDVSGRIQRSYLLDVATDDTVNVSRTTVPLETNTYSITPGQLIPLVGSGISFTLADGVAPQRYAVDTFARPTRDLSAVAASAVNLGEAVYIYLFGLPLVEPFKTFKNLWMYQQELPLRLGALVCALAYRTDLARRTSA